MINEKRSHHCGELSKEQAGEKVVLCGWVSKRRDHGGLIFIDLRDRSGIVQVVADPESAGTSFKTAEDIRNEYVIKVEGIMIEPLWVEAYYFNKNTFSDCNTHLSEKQKNRFGQLYFHEKGRGGFDICLSDSEDYYLSFLLLVFLL